MTNTPPDTNFASTESHVLLLDDEKTLLSALTLLLKAVGFRVTAFDSPPEAIQRLEAGNDFDFFLSDLRMPDMNGIDVLQVSKKLFPGLPFVLMSAHAQDKDIERARSFGLDGFLAKPFSPEDLEAIVSEISLQRVG